jgi:mRNA interferase MazF
MKIFRRGDIVEVNLSGAEGVEKRNDPTSGARPCVVVQNNTGNRFSDSTIIVPLNDIRQNKDLPVQVAVTPEELGFPGSKDSVVECGHIRAIDKKRIIGRLGELDPSAMQRVDNALAMSLNLPVSGR